MCLSFSPARVGGTCYAAYFIIRRGHFHHPSLYAKPSPLRFLMDFYSQNTLYKRYFNKLGVLASFKKVKLAHIHCTFSCHTHTAKHTKTIHSYVPETDSTLFIIIKVKINYGRLFLSLVKHEK